MFGFLKKKNSGILIGSPARGKVIPITEVSDPTFGGEILGKGAAVLPEEGKIYAPADGEITLLFDTLHAVTITSVEGVEILIHIGLDTVELKGEHFKAHVATGDKVKKGDLLISVDLDAVKAAGYQTVTPVVICNTDAYDSVEALAGKDAAPGDDIICIKEK